ncbi:adenylate/guanylate cyclase domain-containing protein [Azospirillum doebereinerae]|uniref:Adenylate/guanylate cyclase domain-containing protein n=1 Tax=Azospirillum doebereinerae TaxID=92933 RepID=A0A3S0VDK4_9PROT|nr:adenylate/guanylate cyclase domain-containing protein [Azospirillum doebereinerae]MCG5241688.1 adenylate/guanylate cyclase domain-containing protein [Azospirillum doebereinerae]RUQ60422.1 adenylate/guanylate cyclase domain-containing protein [Azospirillum doebereinerae]
MAPAEAGGGTEAWRTALNVAVIVAGIAALAVGLTHLVPPLRSADETFGDLQIAYLSPPQPPHPGVALVTLGEDSFATLVCRSPIDRGFLADLIGRLEAAGVRAIGLDILFDQPTLPTLDEGLRRRMLDARIPVVAVTALAETPLTETQRRFLDGFLDGVPRGHANLAKDPLDATVRWHVPQGPDGTPSLPAKLASLAGAAIPDAPFRIDWRPGPVPGEPPFPSYPAELVGLLPPGWLAGRIVLVGTVLNGIDRHRTPLALAGTATPGVETQAQVLAQLLDGRTSPRLSLAAETALTLAMAAAGVALALTGLPLGLLAAVSLVPLAGLWVGGAVLFAQGGPLVPLMAPSMAWLGGTAAMAAHLSLRARADRRVLMRLFANHVSQPVADEIWRERATFMAGNRPRPQHLTATVLFSDIEGFTTVCEALEPEPLMRWLEGYLDAMVRIVAAHDGVVLRFIGDAILAVFGVPVARTTQAQIDADAERAVRCAVQMGRELATLNRQWREEGLPPVGVRVGIHTGPLVAGSMGGLRHMEYSLLGDTANTAARLESHAKTVGARSSPHCRIVIGDPTAQAVRGKIAVLPVGEVALKGKANPVRIWLVVDEPEDQTGTTPLEPEESEKTSL